jgi:hypothetical protein
MQTDSMSPEWEGVSPEYLRRRTDNGQVDLARLVNERRRCRRDVPERDAITHTYDLMIYAGNTLVETSALLLARLEVPAAQHVWDRYLTVYLHAAIESFPKLATRLIRECDRLNRNGHPNPDAETVKAALRTYKQAIKPITGDLDFMSALTRVRNTVGAHHLTTPNNSISGLIAWIAAQEELDHTAADPLVMNTMIWSMHSVKFGQEAWAALKWPDLPPVPEESVEYARRVRAVDDEVDRS